MCYVARELERDNKYYAGILLSRAHALLICRVWGMASGADCCPRVLRYTTVYIIIMTDACLTGVCDTENTTAKTTPRRSVPVRPPSNIHTHGTSPVSVTLFFPYSTNTSKWKGSINPSQGWTFCFSSLVMPART